MIYIILAIAALLTSTLSAIIGMGGGILLLAAMFTFMDHAQAIPSHAAVQIASNGTRILAFIRNVDWRTLGSFATGVFPGAVLGGLLLWLFGQPEKSEPYLKMIVGVYVLLATYLPTPKVRRKVRSVWDFTVLGLVAGTAALTVGAIGPLIAPIFARHDYVKERLIATKATCQMLTHILKIPFFIFVRDLSVEDLGVLTLVMVCMVIPGTLLGRRIVRHVTPDHFRFLYTVALTLAGTKVLIYDGILKAVGAI
jgi:uncharacterized membrane protein YfcA